MDFFSQINKVGKITADFLPVKKLCELDLEKDYQITGVRISATKYGSRVIVDIDNSFACFLPARCAKALAESSDLFEQMKKAVQDNNLLMCYGGGEYNEVQFKPRAALSDQQPQ